LLKFERSDETQGQLPIGTQGYDGNQGYERKGYEEEVTDNLADLLNSLPPKLAERLRQQDNRALIELVFDLGRKPEARYDWGELELDTADITRDDLEYVAGRIGSFGEDNRAGIERTLHRISAIRNRSGAIVGLTCRIGRAVFGTIAIIQDLVESGESILILGRPGVGKTTILRETAACWPTRSASGWLSSTLVTRSPGTATSRTPRSGGRGGCRCRARPSSTG
jgi:hypothetical protein